MHSNAAAITATHIRSGSAPLEVSGAKGLVGLVVIMLVGVGVAVGVGAGVGVTAGADLSLTSIETTTVPMLPAAS